LDHIKGVDKVTMVINSELIIIVTFCRPL